MRKVFERIKRWWLLRKGYYVTLDMRDSSVSFSKGLYERLEPEIMVSGEVTTSPQSTPSPQGGTPPKQGSRGELNTATQQSTPSPTPQSYRQPPYQSRGAITSPKRGSRGELTPQSRSDSSPKTGEHRWGKVMMFREPESECYGFVVSPKLSKETQLADVQFNTKYGTVGFESLVPTVARVLYDYGIGADRVKLSVTEQMCGEMKWYKIERGR